MSQAAETVTSPPPVETVSLTINGHEITAPKGSMIIQAVDEHGIGLPRFCYHRKLSIAAVCRQCMVEVEMNGRKVPKPLVACATPVAEGMKVWTDSPLAIKGQQSALEFVLINHPLECPVCDQGGECELQDLAMSYGRSISRFTERKRSVADEDVGPLVATYMTRCIHCTRCVRFLDEVAGTTEFGDFDRGDRHKIGTYIGSGISSELSGNIIDLCPVGALTNKVFEFKARPWELVARPSIGYHDALGSNLWLHTRRGEVLRTVPRDNEAINECWLSDRDRYSHEGMYADDRLLVPRIKRDGQWRECGWDEALAAVAESLKLVSGPDLGILVSPSTSNEEGALLKRLAEDLGCANIDHRLQQTDLSDNPVAQPFGMPVDAIDKIDAGLIVGSDLKADMPLLHHRLREASKGWPKHHGVHNRLRFDITTVEGAALHVVNPVRFDFNYALASETIVPSQDLVEAVLALAGAAHERVGNDMPVPDDLADAIASASVTDVARQSVDDLLAAESAIVLTGAVAQQHPQASWLRAALRFVADATGAARVEVPTGANAIGLAWQDVLPGDGGLDAHAMLEAPRQAYLLYGIEPPHDFADGIQAMRAMHEAGTVVAFSAFTAPALLEVADVILPLALTPETDATLVNVDGITQALAAGAGAPGDARSGWKALRALGGMMQLDGFTFTSLEQLRASLSTGEALRPATGHLARRNPVTMGDDELVLLATRPIYRTDAVVRRAGALGKHVLNRAPAARMHSDEAARRGLADGVPVQVGGVPLDVVVDEAVPPGCVWVEAAHAATAELPSTGSVVTLRPAGSESGTSRN